MQPIRLQDLPPADYERLLRRSQQDMQAIVSGVRAIIDDVRSRGDAALREYTLRFDHAQLDRLEVTPEEIAQARAALAPELLAALEHAARTISAFHKRQLQPEAPVETAPGVCVWRVWRPIERVGLYIPGGKATYPSSILMSALPARIAGCHEVVLCTPPRPDGTLAQVVLVAAHLAGVQRVFKLGGVQAIAAMAYGTESVPQVYKIFGPGNAYVATAKMLVFGQVAIDMPAGPSEVLILADESADPRWVAADLLAQAEHAEDSACILVTTSRALADLVAAEVERQVETLPTCKIIRAALERYGALLVADSLDEAIKFVNTYAPEHLEIMTANDEQALARVHNAGSIFLGAWSPVPTGDYASGSNHILPTGRYARFFAPLSVESFGRKVQVQRLAESGLAGLRETIETLALAEGLPAHRHAVHIRFAESEEAR
ncbi:MAG TPA: histidinol dehydrogenase [Ktedonobacterales bacterium]|nr:histidinol dehydrogenase [Ktedonobacterales bacterium]